MYICRGIIILIKKIMINKIFLYTLIALIWVYASLWSFNHIDPWVGIGMVILGIYISTKQIFKSNKKTEEK